MDKVAAHILQHNFNLSFSQFRILLAIKKYPLLCQSDIANFHGLTRAAVSRQILLLKKKNYIKVNKSSRSKRERELFLTPPGQKILDKMITKINEVFEKVYANLDKKQQNLLSDSLEKIVNSLNLFSKNHI